jgi:hypothetical protein
MRTMTRSVEGPGCNSLTWKARWCSSGAISSDFQFQALLGVEVATHRTNRDTNFTSQRMAAVSHFSHRGTDPYALNPDTNSTTHASATLGVLVAGLKHNKQTDRYKQ